MKIIYICNSDLGKHGNIGFRTYHVAKKAYSLKQLELIICRGNSQADIPRDKIKIVNWWYRPVNLMLSGISQFLFKKFPARQIQLILFDWLIYQKIKNHKLNGDILHIYEYAPKTIAEAKKQGLKVILDTQMVHGKTADKIHDLKRNHQAEIISSELADRVICSSQFVVDSYIENGIKPEKLALVPHGVDIKKFNFKRKKSKIFTVLYVGIVEKRKGIQYLLEAWKSLNLNNAELNVCGLINRDGKEIIKEYLSNKSIKFRGFTDPVPYYNGADVFVLPSTSESSAKVLYEAMAAGIPIITTFNSGPPFKNGEAGFVIPIRDPVAIQEKIILLKNNSTLRTTMGNHAQRIVQSYSWDNYGGRLMKVYENVLNN